MKSPHPVEIHENSGRAIVESHVASSELLIAEMCAYVPAIEGQVTHIPTRPIFHEDPLLLVARPSSRSHVERDVLETGGLSHLPMDASGAEWCSCHVDDKIADLPVEVVLICIPLTTTASGNIYIRIKRGEAGVGAFVRVERGIDQRSRRVYSIANELREVLHDD